MVTPLPPVLQNVTLFVNKVVTNVSSYDVVILENGGPLLQYSWCSYKNRAR